MRTLIRVSPSAPADERLWRKVGELAGEFGEDEPWCLVGGLMVQLHAFEHAADARPTDDIDVLGNARARPSMTVRLASILDKLGATLAQPPATNPNVGYQFELDGQTVEVLGSEGLEQDPKTVGNYETIQVPGGTQALSRTEKVDVVIAGDPPVKIRRPSLLGATLIKARALAKVREKLEEHREDLVLLLSCVTDPRALAADGDLRGSEKKWLRAVSGDLDFAHPDLVERFDPSARRRAEQAFELLTQ